jgi:hypothetical protein
MLLHIRPRLFFPFQERAEQRIAAPVKVVAIHEVGLDGFRIHRLLDANDVESHVVDPCPDATGAPGGSTGHEPSGGHRARYKGDDPPSERAISSRSVVRNPPGFRARPSGRSA